MADLAVTFRINAALDKAQAAVKGFIAEIRDLGRSGDAAGKALKQAIEPDIRANVALLKGSLQELKQSFFEVQQEFKNGLKVNAKDLAPVTEAARQAFLSTRTAAERYAAELTKLGTLQRSGAIDQETYARAAAKARQELQQAQQPAASVAQQLALARNAFVAFQGALAGFSAGRSFTQTADEAQLLAARVRLATRSADEFRAAQDGLFASSQRQQASLAASTELFARLNPAVQRLGGNYQQTLKISEAVSAALRSSGASTQEAAAATLQFAQALGSGVLQGDEFKSLAETAPRLMQAIADAVGIPRGALKDFAAEGKLTSAVVANAVLAASDQLKAEAASLPLTVSGAFQQLENAFSRYVSSSTAAGAVTRTLSATVSALAANFDALAKGVAFAVEVAVAAIGVRLVAAVAAGTASTGLLAAAATALGGPIGVAAVSIAALAAALFNFTPDADDATERLKRFNDEAERSRGVTGKAGGSSESEVSKARRRALVLQQQIAQIDADVANARRPVGIDDKQPAPFDPKLTERRIALVKEQATLQAQLARLQADQDRQADAERQRRTGAFRGQRNDSPALADDITARLEARKKEINSALQIEKEYRDAVANDRALFSAGIAAEEDPAKRRELEATLVAGLAKSAAKRREALGQLNKQSFDAAKADAEEQQARIAADLSKLQTSIKAGDAIIVQALADGNISIDTAYQARLSQIKTDSAAQLAALEADLEQINRALAKARTPEESSGLTQKQIKVKAEIELLQTNLNEESRKLGLWKAEQERNLSNITARVRVEVANITGKFDREAVQQQVDAQLAPDVQAARRIEDPQDAVAAEQRVQLIGKASVAQAEFNSVLAEAQRIQAQQASAEAAINQQAQSGAISQTEAEVRLGQARAAQDQPLADIADRLRAIRDALPPEASAVIDQMTDSISKLKIEVDKTREPAVDLFTKLQNQAIDGFPNAVANAVTGVQSLRSAVASTMKSIAADILRSGVKEAFKQVFGAGSGGGGSGGGGFWGTVLSFGKSLFGFAEGGQVRGPGTGTSDSIPALVGGRRPVALSDREFVHPVRAVDHYGVGFMEAVRTLRFPKPGYAFGGLVRSAQQQTRFASGGQAAAGGAADRAPKVTVQVINQGTPQRVTSQTQTFDGRDQVISILLDDLQRNGPYTQASKRRG